jgi:CheY-like chemotaxis protein
VISPPEGDLALSLLTRLAPHLPYLRRYARALMGSQAAGDLQVKVTLQGLANGTAVLIAQYPARVSLYRAFHLIWSSGDRVLKLDPASTEGKSHEPGSRILRITPRSRQAFLLTAMEGFSASETAMILGVGFPDVARLLAQAQNQLDAELATDVLIIEDEPVISADIEALVAELGHSVIDIATTRAQALAAAKHRRPGLVLADIQLADGSSGIDAARDILDIFDVPIIFITAFPERLLTGERPEPTFLITKPFHPETVKAAIGQALFFNPQPAPIAS